jgi:type II secretory pathway pseudopilin PulG
MQTAASADTTCERVDLAHGAGAIDEDHDLAAAVERRSRRRDGGMTFVETVVTVVLLGVVIVPILAAVRGAIRTSSVTEAAAQVETVLINAADKVQRAPNVGDACDFTSFAQSAATAQGWPASSVAVQHEHLDNLGAWQSGACPAGGDQANLAKRITITVSSPGHTVTRTIQVVKSDV